MASRKRSIIWAFLLASIWACSPKGQAVEDQRQPAEIFPTHVHTQLITEHASIQPWKGKTLVGVHFQIEPGWHIYYKESGDAGLPTKIVWTGPREATFGPLIWPAPQEFTDPGEIHTQGYTGDVVLASELRMDLGPTRATVLPSSIPVKAEVSWLACKELCVPGRASLELSLPLTTDPPKPSEHANLFPQG